MTETAEVFFANGKVDEDGDPIIWKTILTPGRLELTPGPNGKKQKKPLIIVEGHSDDPDNIIGLQDLMDSYEDGAIQHVTIPTSHANNVLENTGYIRGLRLVEEDGKNVLKGGFEFLDPAVKEKVNEGTIANVSCGILRNYERQRDGKPFRSVIEHVALTNKPWVDGMTPFSDETDHFYFAEQEVDLAVYNQSKNAPFDYTAHGVEEINPGNASGPKWDSSASMLARRHILEDELNQTMPDCTLIDFTPSRVLLEDSNEEMYITGYSVNDDGSVSIHPQEEWIAYSPINDLSEDQKEKEGGNDPMDEVLLAERDELATKLAEAEERARLAEEKSAAQEATNRKVEREAAAKERVRELGALGLSGFPGFLNAVEGILLADEGTVALNLSEDGKDKEYTATDIVNRLVDALPKKDDKIVLGEQHTLLENDLNPLEEEKPKTAQERAEEAREWLGLNQKKTVLA